MEQLERAVARLEDRVARLRRKENMQPKSEGDEEEEEEKVKDKVEKMVVEKVGGMSMRKSGV